MIIKQLSGPAKIIRDYMWDQTGPPNGRWQTVAEIHTGVVQVRGTSTSTGAVAKTLNDLEGMGLLKVDDRFRPKRYQWNPAEAKPSDYQGSKQSIQAVLAAAKGKGSTVTTPTGTLTDDQKRQALRGKLKNR